jgi:hypothetical protein
MGFLPSDVEADLIRKQSGVPITIARLIVAYMNIIRNKGLTAPSLQEGMRLAQTLKIAESALDVKLLIEGWLCKVPEDWEALEKDVHQPHAVLWGEWKKIKGGQ